MHEFPTPKSFKLSSIVRDSLSPDTRNAKFQLQNLETDYRDLQTFSVLEKQMMAAEFYEELQKTKDQLQLAHEQIERLEETNKANEEKSLGLDIVSMVEKEDTAKR